MATGSFILLNLLYLFLSMWTDTGQRINSTFLEKYIYLFISLPGMIKMKVLERQFSTWKCLGVGDNSQQGILLACKRTFSSTVLFKLFLWHGYLRDKLNLSFVLAIVLARKDVDEQQVMAFDPLLKPKQYFISSIILLSSSAVHFVLILERKIKRKAVYSHL